MVIERNATRGRPRQFDEDRALDAAVALFASNGFTASSLSELTKATGLSVSSLYKAFGDKDGVFLRALERYISVREAAIGFELERGGSGREKLAAIIRLYAGWSQGDEGRTGCMVVAGFAELDLLGDTAARLLRDVLVRRRALLSDLVEEGQRDGSIRSCASPASVADLLLTIVQGMRVVGKGGLFPPDAEPLVALALHAVD